MSSFHFSLSTWEDILKHPASAETFGAHCLPSKGGVEGGGVDGRYIVRVQSQNFHTVSKT